MSIERLGNYITTFTGGRWWPHDPRPEDVRVEDLASLAQVNRFGGATSYRWPEWRVGMMAPYSVAQHSCLVYELVCEWIEKRELANDFMLPDRIRLVKRAALLHDGHEIYPPGDQLSPVLRFESPATEALKAMSRAAATAFRTATKIPQTMPEIVKRADLTMLATEKRDLMHPELESWGDNGRVLPPPRERRIEVWDAEHARDAFFWRLRHVAPELFAASSEP